MLFCCNKNFFATYSFYVDDKNCLNKRIEFGYCPHCKKAIYKEFKIDFKNNKFDRILKGKEAQRAFSKALFNRIMYVSKVKQGTKENQYWHYGDCLNTNKKDYKGNIIQIQVKKNFNNETVEKIGESKVIYK